MRAVIVCCLMLIAGCTKQSSNAVKLGIYPVLDWFPFYLAASLGHFQAEGVEVNIEELNQGTKLMEALVAGSLDVSADALSYAVIMSAQGRRFRSFFNVYDSNLPLLVVSPSHAGRVREVAALKGALVGVSSFGGIQHRMLLFILKRFGLSERDVRLASIGTGATSAAALQYGKVDAAIINGSSFRLLQKQVNGTRILVDLRSREQSRALFGVEAYPGGAGMLATEKWLATNPVKARQLARGLRRTLDWIRAHTVEQVYDHVPAALRSDREVDLQHLRVSIGLLSPDGRIPAGGPEAVQRVLAASMETAMSVDLASTWTNEFLEAQ